MRKLFHGSNVTVSHPEIRIHKYTKDFSWGFYCTDFERQAIRWATRYDRPGFVNVYTYTENPDLLVKTFPGLTEEWLELYRNVPQWRYARLRYCGRPHG